MKTHNTCEEFKGLAFVVCSFEGVVIQTVVFVCLSTKRNALCYILHNSSILYSPEKIETGNGYVNSVHALNRTRYGYSSEFL